MVFKSLIAYIKNLFKIASFDCKLLFLILIHYKYGLFYTFEVTRSYLREVLHSVDASGITERRRRRLHRRVYSVMAPNHLWHVDTNHKPGGVS